MTWYSYRQDFGRLKGDMCYEYTADKKILTLPTITVYTPKMPSVLKLLHLILMIIVTRKKCISSMKNYVIILLKVFFPDMAKQDLIDMYENQMNRHISIYFKRRKGFIVIIRPVICITGEELNLSLFCIWRKRTDVYYSSESKTN